MADSKISALVAATTLNLSDMTVLVQGGNSLSLSVQTLALKMPSRIIINEATEAPASGVISQASLVSKLTTAVAPVAYTLAAGSLGMEKQLIVGTFVSTGTAVVTVTTTTGFVTLTFTTANSTAYLKNIDGRWCIMSSYGVTIA